MVTIDLKRGVVPVLTLLALASCGGDGPTEPDVLPTANLVSESAGAWTNCSGIGGTNSCSFVGDGRNLGPGCANVVRGVVRFLDAAGAQLGASRSWQFSPAASVFRPNEAFVFTVTLVSRVIVDATASTQQEFSWTDTAC